MNYKISIVVLSYKKWNLTQNLMTGLHKHERDSIDEIVIVDDCSEDAEVEGGLEFWTMCWDKIHVIRNDVNLGFTLSANIGLEYATRDPIDRKIVFLISNDVSVNGKFIEKSVDLLTRTKRTFVGHRLLSWDTGWNTFDGVTFPYLEGYFLACTSDGWRDLGHFDPNYAPYDMEDVDICTLAKKKGYVLEATNNPFISHIGAATHGYTPERLAITLRNKEYFRRKWLHG